MPVSKKEALLKTLYDVKHPKETVSVVHAAFEEKSRLVAFVEVEKEWSDTKKLEHAFMKTNTIEEAWYTSKEGIEYMGPEKSCRSTSVGDFVLIGAKKYKCEMAGWELV
tara:strand:+ start:433 stop:759 length:327 start_codon:yes stop_codon:yes gene_type:complete